MFELYATGNHSLSQLPELLQADFGQRLAKGYLDRLLKNPFLCWIVYLAGETI
jgi:hypothetical protein